MPFPKIAGATVVIGIPSFGSVSTHFLQARTQISFPLVSSAVDKVVLNKPIADARNEIVEFALSQGSSHIFWLDDDVIAPPDSFLKLYSHHKDIINGVYWSKSNPPMPLLFRGHLRGPYYDWHVGDLIEIDAAGSGLTLVRTDVYRKIQKEIGEPWYSVDFASFPGATSAHSNNTEDIYFYWKARKAGYKVWADTSVQALHYDKYNDIFYHLPPNAPQAKRAWEIKPPGTMLIADLGAGKSTMYMGDDGEVVTFDIREDVKPDVVCDLRRIPVPDETFDKVFSAHTLEHFPYTGVEGVIREWARILKVGGELHIVVPNLRYVGKRLTEDAVIPQDMWLLYGEQDYAKNYHAAGFTPKLLESLIQSTGMFSNIQIREGDLEGPPVVQNYNLELKALKSQGRKSVDNVTPEDMGAAPFSESLIKTPIWQEYNERPKTEEDDVKADEYWKARLEVLEAKRELINKLGQYPDNQVFHAYWDEKHPPTISVSPVDKEPESEFPPINVPAMDEMVKESQLMADFVTNYPLKSEEKA